MDDTTVWTKISETVEKQGYKTIIQKQFAAPDGKQVTCTTWGRNDGNCAGVIALTPDNKVIVSRQFRPGPERIFDELPGGSVDSGEEPAVAAARELLEETGYATTDPLEYLGPTYRDAYSNETSHYFLARNCRKVAGQALDEGELVEIAEISIAQYIANAKNGKMTDGIAVLMGYDRLMEIQEEQRL